MRKRIIVLGSTGSIGRATLEVVQSLGGEARVVGLAAGGRWRDLAEQAERLSVSRLAIADERHYDALRRERPGAHVMAGPAGLVELIESTDADFVLSAIVGAAGLPATYAAVQRGIDVGIANKESLVVAGSILAPLAQERGVRLIPVDSEHSAIFQALQSGQRSEVRRLYLTASGGPFRTWCAERIREATLEEALRHPTWEMGPKITIDSATMMNKALEVIEARHLFDVSAEDISVLVHPESIVHSMVEFCDGSLIAQLGTPDMKTPIQYALTWPKRAPAPAPSLEWEQARTLTFEPPDFERFPALELGFAAARHGGNSGAALNAANEAAVELFRHGEIPFWRICELAADVFHRRRHVDSPTMEQLLECDAWARDEVRACLT